MNEIKSIQINNLHNNGALYEVGKKGVFQILDRSIQFETSMYTLFVVKNKNDEQIAFIENTPVHVICKVSETEKPVQTPLSKEPKFNFKKSLIELGVEEQVASDWLKVRAKLKGVNTKTVFDKIKREILLTTEKPNECIKRAVEWNWRGFEAKWYFNKIEKTDNTESQSGILGHKYLTLEEKKQKHINLKRTYIWSNIDGSDYAGLMTDEEKTKNGKDITKNWTIQGREVK